MASDASSTPPLDPLQQLGDALSRSTALAGVIQQAWTTLPEQNEAKARVTAGLCSLCVDHGLALQLLLSQLTSSAIALLRPQYESLVRAVWIAHAANSADVKRLASTLTIESQQAAKKVPGVPEMLAAIERCGPPGAAKLLGRARTRLGDGLNSYVHGGIHPLARQRDGYPVTLLLDVLRNSNAMSMLTLVVLAELTGDADVAELLSALGLEFGDVLPALEISAD